METKEFVKTINNTRLKNKHKWYFWGGNVNGKNVQIKGYGTWLQIYRVNGITILSPMEISVTKFKTILARGVK